MPVSRSREKNSLDWLRFLMDRASFYPVREKS